MTARPAGTFRWLGGTLRPAPAGDGLLAADSWLAEDGRVRGFDLHRGRFAGSCRDVAGLAADDVHAFLDACLAVVPAAGRWFPRVECARGPALWLRLRAAPRLADSAVLWPFPGGDPRTAPLVKGPDLAVLGEVRAAARARGADEAVLCSPDGTVLEGALSALVWWRGGRLCLPDPALPTLDSVTRRLVVRLAERTGTPAGPERARLRDLDGLEVWALSALHGIRYVSGWLGTGMRPGPARRAGQWRHMLAGLALPGRAWLRHSLPGESRVRLTMADISTRAAPYQPDWPDPAVAARVRAELSAQPALVRFDDVAALRWRLAAVAAGEALVLQCGDCAEDPADRTPFHIARKTAVIDLLAARLKLASGMPVVRAGRIAGQFAKPRSSETEIIGGVELPVFRGHMVNGPGPDLAERTPDPLRILSGYLAAGTIMENLGWRLSPAQRAGRRAELAAWTSHEALLLDYEMPMIRQEQGVRWLGSTHWPWVGERTRHARGPHVALLATIANPVACKVGPAMTGEELLEVCGVLDPAHEPGRLTLISRMGAGVVRDRLPPLVAAVRRAGHPVIWLCDPMHGNTVRTRTGAKTRRVEDIAREVREFRLAVASAGGTPGGLHLETTPDDVTECTGGGCAGAGGPPWAGGSFLSHCDPRLNPGQALAVVGAWC